MKRTLITALAVFALALAPMAQAKGKAKKPHAAKVHKAPNPFAAPKVPKAK